MPKICYVEKSFHGASMVRIQQANQIINEFQEQGFVLTLRQLFYQFVARDLIPNTQTEYKKLGSLINDARLAGLIDWNAIEDRTRNLRGRSHWEGPEHIIRDSAAGYGRNLWADQECRCEVWIEKDALVGVVERVCTKWDVPYFSCRGYTSQSEAWIAAQRHIDYGVPVNVIHLGDHDPSGWDMSRDIQNRLSEIFGAETMLHRIALNTNQVRRYKLPPNPAKVTDSRFRNYVAKYGKESWELDALNPGVIESMIEAEIFKHLDLDKFIALQRKEGNEKAELRKLSDNYKKAIRHVSKS